MTASSSTRCYWPALAKAENKKKWGRCSQASRGVVHQKRSDCTFGKKTSRYLVCISSFDLVASLWKPNPMVLTEWLTDTNWAVTWPWRGKREACDIFNWPEKKKRFARYPGKSTWDEMLAVQRQCSDACPKFLQDDELERSKIRETGPVNYDVVEETRASEIGRVPPS